MDWELYERQRATLLLVGVVFVCGLLLGFQKTLLVKHLRAVLVRTTLPPQRFLSRFKAVPMTVESPGSPATPGTPESQESAESQVVPEQKRLVQVLREENSRLREALALQRHRWPRAVVAHVAGRDPQRWFQEIVLDKGCEDGLAPDSAVLAVLADREGLVGRITECSAHVSKAMLLQDPLSAVAATLVGSSGDDGVVEGSDGHTLLLKYLDRSSAVKIGDLVETSGLGKAFPPGIPIGWVQEIGLDPRQLFLQARLRPAVKANQLRMVLVLVP
jgi:rod shape-determining protein MreC